MQQRENVIFELDLPTGQVLFHLTSSWAKFLHKQAGIPYDYQEIVELCVERFVSPEYKEIFMQTLSLSSLRDAQAKKKPLKVLQGLLFNMQTNTYEWYHINLVISVNGKCFGTIQNMQEDKHREEQLLHDASHDTLSDLYNRDAFRNSVTNLMADVTCSGAFFILDIDNFKTINDTTGHQQGDTVIVGLSRMLQEQFPEKTVFGRFGGDEFTFFVPGGANPEEYRQLAKTFCSRVEHHWKSIGVTVSTGISIYPTQAGEIEELLALADRALYYVKNNGKNGCAIFDKTMQTLDAPSPTVASVTKKTRLKAFNWRRFFACTAAIVLLLTILWCLSRAYYVSLQKTIQAESSEYLMEISRQIGGGITNRLGTTLSYLEAMGDFIPREDISSMQELSSLLEAQCQRLMVDSLVAVDQDGIEYKGERPVYHAILQEHIARVLLDREAFMTDTIHIDGMDYVLFFVPIESVEIEDIHISALVAYVSMDSMNNMLSLTAFENATFAEIVNRNGAIVVRSGHSDSLLSGYNLFTSFAQEKFSDGYGIERLKEDFEKGTNGVTRYMQEKGEYVSYYSKLEGQDWMLFCTTPAHILESKSNIFIRITIVACAVVAILIFGLMSGLMLLQQHSKKQLEVVAYTDRVTLGANREKFVKDLQLFLPRTNDSLIMLYANVEHFKLVNERFGSEEADKLLRYMFRVFKADLKENEFVARIAGDHFALLMKALPVQLLEERICLWNRKIAMYPALVESGFTITVTYGAYHIENNNLSVDVMIDRANIARKDGTTRLGSASVYFYDFDLQEAMKKEQELENVMGTALAEGEFQMYLQPKCRGNDGMVIGFEALVRWIRPDGTIIPPNDFIPLFERNGFVARLDHHMFELACRTLKMQLDQGDSPVPISVNVSRIHLVSKDLLAPYLKIWERYRVPTNLLEFEFTESTIYDNIELLQGVVENIHRAGFSCSIDDFGAGYSSLNMLNRTNMDIIKIDRGFLGTGPDISERSRNIIRSIIQLSHKVGMLVVTEGVETLQQANFLRECGCDFFQGFYFGSPQPIQEALTNTNKILPKE